MFEPQHRSSRVAYIKLVDSQLDAISFLGFRFTLRNKEFTSSLTHIISTSTLLKPQLTHQFKSLATIRRDMFSSQFNSSATASSSAIEPADPLYISLPADIDITISQPTGPVLMFCWINSHNGGNKVYRCKLCGGQFTGSPILAMTHFNAKMSNQQLKLCKGNQPRAPKDQLKILLDKKLASENFHIKEEKNRQPL